MGREFLRNPRSVCEIFLRFHCDSESNIRERCKPRNQYPDTILSYKAVGILPLVGVKKFPRGAHQAWKFLFNLWTRGTVFAVLGYPGNSRDPPAGTPVPGYTCMPTGYPGVHSPALLTMLWSSAE
eukprot:1315985-Rhodomonas_salina.1